jgi:hypothetical protein
MTTKINLLRKMRAGFKMLIPAFSVLLLCSCSTHKDADIRGEVYKSDNGYGYYIFAKNKLLVKQDFIPALQGEKKFCDSTDAAKVSRLVIHKINSKKMPAITIKELDSLNIKTKC